MMDLAQSGDQRVATPSKNHNALLSQSQLAMSLLLMPASSFSSPSLTGAMLLIQLRSTAHHGAGQPAAL